LNVERTIKTKKAESIIEEISYTVSQWKKFADKENVSPELCDKIADNLLFGDFQTE
jgi:hypothetical protein